MQNDNTDTPTETIVEEAAPAAVVRSEAYRKRFLQSQLVAAQIAKARSAGGTPPETEAARLIAEFHAKGGEVTMCPQVAETPPDEREAAKPRKGPLPR